MSRLSQQQQDRTYVELHIAELQRMANAYTKLPHFKTDLLASSVSEIEIITTLNRVQMTIGRGVDRHAMHGTGLPDALADATLRILDLCERMGIDLGAALATRFSGGSG
jgi:predicted aconitase